LGERGFEIDSANQNESNPLPKLLAMLRAVGQGWSQWNDMIVFLTFLFVLVCLLIVSLKTGKIINGRVGPNMPRLIDRKVNPSGYWNQFVILSLFVAFAIGTAIWACFHGAPFFPGQTAK
jgi:hypothetical protein